MRREEIVAAIDEEIGRLEKVRSLLLLSLTLICYCHLVGMAKIVRGSTFVRP